MAGQPKMKALRETMAELGEDWLFERMADGKTVTACAKEVGVSRQMLYLWVHQRPEREQAFKQARKLAAHALVDDAVQILDDAKASESTLARERAKFRQWMASKMNRESYGEEKAQVAVNLSVGMLHLTAVQNREARLKAAADELVVEPAVESVEVSQAKLELPTAARIAALRDR